MVLVHGLDDPGKVWMNLAPALARAGFGVWVMSYPNDQPIVDSARLMGREMEILTSRGAHQAIIVAHSMGGLVSREMLTNPDIAYLQRVHGGTVPMVVELIMVGTPNHGSEVARLRTMAEFRDQWVNFIEGRGHWLRWVLDGAGEAEIDLLPGSRFLTKLNGRPHPPGVKLSVIAGVISPWEQAEIAEWLDALRIRPPGKADEGLSALEAWVQNDPLQLSVDTSAFCLGPA